MKLRKGRHDCRLWRSSFGFSFALLLSASSSAALAQDAAEEAVESAAEEAEEAVEAAAGDAAYAAEEPAAVVAAAEVPDEDVENIVITGYGSALSSGLNQRRMAVTSRESIFAGDMAKIPDLNLAEAIQRVPGVTISYEGGEGRQVTLRGLGPQFTRTTLNGMEVPASTDGLDSSGGLNGGRAFDFNVFASELFNRIDINKSPRASIEEGGLAGTIDLYSPRPLDNPGIHAAVTAKGGYNLLTETADPRLAGLVSGTFFENKLGVAFSAAYTRRTVRQEGFGSVRWDKFDLDRTPEGEDKVWMPRLPRLDYFANEQQRLGITGTLQFKPSDRFDITVDYLHSNLDNDRTNYNVMAQFRNEFDRAPINVEGTPVRAADGVTIVSGNFSNVPMRTENRIQLSETQFHQIVANLNGAITDSIKVHGIAGYATSEGSRSQFRYNIDSAEGVDLGYDFSGNENFPTIDYSGIDLNDPASYVWGGNEQLRNDEVLRENFTAGFDFNWTEGLTSLKAGLIYNQRTVERSRVDATRKELDQEQDGQIAAGALRPFPPGNFGSGFAPDGIPESFLVVDFDRAFSLWEVGSFADQSRRNTNAYTVQENILSGFVELNAEADLLGRPLRVNGGIRVARTEQQSDGFFKDPLNDNAITDISLGQDYVTVLPSANFVWEATSQVQLRLGISRSMTRPGLGALNPTTTVDPGNQRYTVGNPNLSPIISTNVDTAIEWFFTESSMVGASFFYKDIDSFIATDVQNRDLDPNADAAIIEEITSSPEYDPERHNVEELPYEFRQPINNDGAELVGVELALQTSFFFLPGFLSDFGIQLNYTYVESESEYGFGDAAVISSLVGLSNHSYNGTLYYEGARFGGRVSVNGRSDFVSRVPGGNNNAEEKTDEYVNVAALLYYDIVQDLGPLQNVTLTLEGFNLTDQAERLFVTGNGSQDLVREYNHTGRQFFLGLRARI